MLARQIPDDYFPRWRWLWQLSILTVTLALSVVICLYSSAWVSHARLTTMIDAYREALMPMTDGDVALLQIQAGKAAPPDDPNSLPIVIVDKSYFPLLQMSSLDEVGVHCAIAEFVVKRNEDTLAWYDRALASRGYALDSHRDPLAYDAPLLRLLSYDVAARSNQGRLNEAIDRLIEMFEQVHRSRGRPASNAKQIQLNIWNYELTDYLRTRIGIMIQSSAYEVDPARIRRLISLLSDDSSIRERWREAVIDERIAAFARISAGASEPIFDAPLYYPSPVTAQVRLALVELLEYSRLDEELALASDATTYARRYHRVPVRFNLADRYAHSRVDAVLSRPAGNSLFAMIAECRCTAVAIAAAWYVREMGEPPTAISDLVPDYLERALTQPFCDDDRPIDILHLPGRLYIDGGGRFWSAGRADCGMITSAAVELPLALVPHASE